MITLGHEIKRNPRLGGQGVIFFHEAGRDNKAKNIHSM